jgi:hypothetical protein
VSRDVREGTEGPIRLIPEKAISPFCVYIGVKLSTASKHTRRRSATPVAICNYGYNTSPFRIRTRKPNCIDMLFGPARETVRTIRVPHPYLGAACLNSRSGRRHFSGVWVSVEDGRTLVYSAKSGRLLRIVPDPFKDRRLQSALARLEADRESKLRYAVIFPVARTSNGFYNFAHGKWEWNRITDGAMFKDRRIAVAAAKILTDERRGSGAVMRPLGSRALQVVTYKIGQRTLLSSVRKRFMSYVPILSPIH